MASTFNRRDFLVYGGATVAGVTLGETGRRWLARVEDRVAATGASPVVDTWVASVCRECPATCGIRVRIVEATPVKLEGNPNCPISRGRLCAKGHAALESFFDPDRLVGPARRIGKREENRWAAISWDEAVALCASHLDPHAPAGSIVAISADERGPIDDAWTKFWTGLHARVAWTPTLTAERLAPAFTALTGAAGDPVFDVEHATHVLSLGAAISDDWLSPLWTQRSFGRFRRGARRSRGRLVQVDARRSLTARKADEWLPVAADRQASLAYGIASVLFREDRVDRARLAELGGNVNDFEREVVSRYTPDAVALATGIPVVTLLRLARDLTSTPQPLVAVAPDAPRDVADAAFALNALIGAIDRPGGVLEGPARSIARREGHTAGAALAEIGSREQPPTLVAFRDASALRALTVSTGAAAHLERCGFVVSFSPYLDETAAVADLLLPTHTPLETWQAVVPPTSDGAESFACARAAVAPRLDTRDVVTVLRTLAEHVGGDLPAACPAASSEDVIRADMDRVWHLRRGAPYASGFETTWVRQLERGGWWVPAAASAAELSDVVLNAGGWVDPFFDAGQLRSSIAQHGGLTFLPPAGRSIDARVPDVVTASFERTAAASDADPSMLRLTVFTPAGVNLAGGPNAPALFELLGQPDSSPWRVWGELNPETARRLGIAHGAPIRVSAFGASIEIVATLVDRTPADAIAIAYVPSLASGGRWARLMNADVRRLLDPGRAGVSGPIDVRVAAV